MVRKQARLAIGNRQQTTVDFMQQDTAWYERQLIDTQFVGEFKSNPVLQARFMELVRAPSGGFSL